MTLNEHNTLKAFEEVIKKESRFIKSFFHRILYGASPSFLLASCILALISIIVAWRITKVFTQTQESFRNTFTNSGESNVLVAPLASTKKPGSILTFINNPRTLTNSNTFQDLGNCKDGLCVELTNRCYIVDKCNCIGVCVSSAAACSAMGGDIVDLATGFTYAQKCQTELNNIATNLGLYNASPPAWKSFFDERTINIQTNSGIVTAKLKGCSRLNDECTTVSAYDKSLSLLSDGYEWYFANLPIGFV